MSVALWVRSLEAVPEEVRREIAAEGWSTGGARWSEPPTFSEPGDADGVLEGWSKVPPMSVEFDDGRLLRIPETDWCFMVWWDSVGLVDRLAEWSRRYGLAWELTSEGERIGRVARGVPDRALQRSLSYYAKAGGATGDRRIDAGRAEELAQRYAAISV